MLRKRITPGRQALSCRPIRNRDFSTSSTARTISLASASRDCSAVRSTSRIRSQWDSRGNIYVGENFDARRFQRFLYKGLGTPVPGANPPTTIVQCRRDGEDGRLN
jgi:hypothetical protein